MRNSLCVRVVSSCICATYDVVSFAYVHFTCTVIRVSKVCVYDSLVNMWLSLCVCTFVYVCLESVFMYLWILCVCVCVSGECVYVWIFV